MNWRKVAKPSLSVCHWILRSFVALWEGFGYVVKSESADKETKGQPDILSEPTKPDWFIPIYIWSTPTGPCCLEKHPCTHLAIVYRWSQCIEGCGDERLRLPQPYSIHVYMLYQCDQGAKKNSI